VDKRTIVISNEDLEMKLMGVNVIDECIAFVQIERFSSFQRLVRVTAYVLRFVKLLKRKTSVNSKFLSIVEIEEAEQYLLKIAQEESFPEELRVLNEGKKLEKKSRLYQLEPYVCSKGIMRIKGKLDRLNGQEDFKHPICAQRTT